MGLKKLVTPSKKRKVDKEKSLSKIVESTVDNLKMGEISKETVTDLAKTHGLDPDRLAEELMKYENVELVRYDMFSALPAEWDKDEKIYVAKGEW